MFPGHYDTKSAPQRILADQASKKMARTHVFKDTTTRNRPYSIFWRTKRPRKWPERLFSRTLRHEIRPTAYSGRPCVHENGPNACFQGHYDTKSALQHILADQASMKMARTPVFTDATTQNRSYSIFWRTKRPGFAINECRIGTCTHRRRNNCQKQRTA